MKPVRVLVVDDCEPWYSLVATMLQKEPELQIIGQVSDGLEAVQRAEQLQPDLILLDIGLPTLNGLEAARRIREFSPKSKIIFVSQESSADVVQEAFKAGATGYVVKTDAGSELLVAIDAALRGDKFVGRKLLSHGAATAIDARAFEDRQRHNLDIPARQVGLNTAGRHEVGFYSDDGQLLDWLTPFIGDALKIGNGAVVVATESHRRSLLPRLQAYGVDMVEAIEQGRYITNAADMISTFIVNDMLDTGRFMNAVSNLILTAAKAAKRAHLRVAFFGEGTNLLLKQGHVQAVIQDEKLCNELIKMYDVDILCGFSAGSAEAGLDNPIFQLICAEHTAVHSW